MARSVRRGAKASSVVGLPFAVICPLEANGDLKDFRRVAHDVDVERDQRCDRDNNAKEGGHQRYDLTRIRRIFVIKGEHFVG